MQWGPPSRARKSTFCLERYRYLFIRFCWVSLTNQIRTSGPSLWKGSRCKSPQVTWPSSDHSRCCQRPANLLGSARTAAAFACPCVWTRLCPVPPPDIGHSVADQLRGAEADRWQDEPSRPSPSILSWSGVSHTQLCGCFSFVQLTKKFFLQDTLLVQGCGSARIHILFKLRIYIRNGYGSQMRHCTKQQSWNSFNVSTGIKDPHKS